MKGDFTLGEFVISPELRTISRAGATLRVEPKAMCVLVLLAQEVGHVVPKERLIQTVWGHSYVTDDVLTGSISSLRKALNDSARLQQIIQTIPKGGYRLIGPLRWIDADTPISTEASLPAPERSLQRWLPQIGRGQVGRHLFAIGFALLAAAVTLQLLSMKSTPTNSLRRPHEVTMGDTPLIAPAGNRPGAGSARYAISERLTPDPRFAAADGEHARYTPDAESHRLYVLGRYHWNKRTADGLERALSFFQEAIARDRNNAIAWSALADTYNVLPDWGSLSPHEAFPRAKAAALEALRLDALLAEAHAALAYAIGNYEWDWAQAEQEFRRALRLNPEYPSAHQWYAMQLASLGRFPEALEEIRVAQQLDPVSPVIAMDAAEILYAAGRNDAAIGAFRNAIDLNPAFAEAHSGLASVYERLGQYDIVVHELGKAAELRGDLAFGAILARAYARSGYPGVLKVRLKGKLRERAGGRHGSAAEIAQLYTALGRKRAALDWLQVARDDRDTCVVFMTATQEFDSVRGDVSRLLHVSDARAR